MIPRENQKQAEGIVEVLRYNFHRGSDDTALIFLHQKFLCLFYLEIVYHKMTLKRNSLGINQISAYDEILCKIAVRLENFQAFIQSYPYSRDTHPWHFLDVHSNSA